MEATDEPISGSTIADAPKARAFSASEMVVCGTCSRANPPTRTTCLYCGAALKSSELNAFPSALVQDTHPSSEVAVHVVALSSIKLEEAALNEIAGLIDIKPSDLQSLLTHSAGAPVFVATSTQQAQITARNLEARGVNTKVISDEQLTLQRAPAQISALEISNDSIAGSVGRSKQAVVASWDEITLVVIGRLYFETREIDQKRRRSKQVMDEREMLTDESVLDVYMRSDDCGWRIRAGNFDFSCLGENKKLTTFENFTSLASLLRARATAAVWDDSYVHLRSALNAVWPNEPSASAKERRHNAFGDFDLSVTSVDNELQFTRYSRLCRQLHTSNCEDHGLQI